MANVRISDLEHNAGGYIESIEEPTVGDLKRMLTLFGFDDAPLFIKGGGGKLERIEMTSWLDLEDGKFRRFVTITGEIPEGADDE